LLPIFLAKIVLFLGQIVSVYVSNHGRAWLMENRPSANRRLMEMQQ